MSRYIKTYEQVLPPSFCQDLIARFEKDGRTRPDPQPEYSRRHYLPIFELPEWQDACLTLSVAAQEVLSDFFHVPDHLAAVGIGDWMDDGFIMSRYQRGDICAMHVDSHSAVPPFNGLRLATLIFYLNACEAGETHFPLQEVKIKPEAGRALVFPPFYTHPHEALPAGSPRYMIQTWIVDPRFAVVPSDMMEEDGD